MNVLRSISSWNVIYKFIAKALANRLKKLLSKVISPNQSAFIQGRAITDSILISTEILHYLHKKSRGKKAFMAKAYDRVEYSF